MKILYYASVNSRRESGVLKKVHSQVKAWQAQGNETVLITVSTEKQGLPLIDTPANVTCYDIQSKAAALFSGAAFKLLNRTLTVFRVRKLIKAHAPDVIYMRECIWFPFIRVLLGGGAPVVIEINSLLKNELRYSGLFQRTLYRLFQKSVYARVAGIVGVTREITDGYAVYGKPSVVIANGYDLESAAGRGEADRAFPASGGARPENKNRAETDRPALVFAGSPGMPWHGSDRIREMALRMPEFDFHIVGAPEDGKEPLPNLVFYGYMGHAGLKILYTSMDVGIGSLALYRKQMHEGCPLKVREYLANGLPVIIGYEDTDLSGQGLDFVLQQDPHTLLSEDSLRRVRAFVHYWKGKRVSRAVAAQWIGNTGKEAARIAFFKEVVSSRF